MPYIKPHLRKELDPIIDELYEKISQLGVANVFSDSDSKSETEAAAVQAGMLNYSVTRLLILLIGKPRYWKIALWSGVISNINSELYRRLAAPYEDEQVEANGDVY